MSPRSLAASAADGSHARCTSANLFLRRFRRSTTHRGDVPRPGPCSVVPCALARSPRTASAGADRSNPACGRRVAGSVRLRTRNAEQHGSSVRLSTPAFLTTVQQVTDQVLVQGVETSKLRNADALMIKRGEGLLGCEGGGHSVHLCTFVFM